MNQIDFTKLKPAQYSRKSSEGEDRQMLSISSQDDANKRSAEYYKLPVFIDIFQEAKSAKTESARPEFSRMMDAIARGSIDCIVCWKADRLARNMAEGGKIIDLLSSGKIKAIICHDKVYYPWDNVMLLSLEFSQGKQFVKELSVNVKRGQTKKASMGFPHGVAALGFLNDKSEEKGNRKWNVDATRLEAIKVLFEMFLTGTYSVGKLYKHAVGPLKLTTVKRKRSGGEHIVISRMYELLRDPIYAGFFYYGGERYELEKSLPRLITEAQHEKIKAIISGRNIPKTQHHTTTYSGFITSDTGDSIGQDVKFQLICDCKHKFAFKSKTTCPRCGVAIEQMENPKHLFYTWHYNVRKKKAKLPYTSLNEKNITSSLVDLFSNKLVFSQDIIDWSKKYIREMKDKEVNSKVFLHERQKERDSEFEEKKRRTRSMLRDEQITQEEYDADIATLQREYPDTKEKKSASTGTHV